MTFSLPWLPISSRGNGGGRGSTEGGGGAAGWLSAWLAFTAAMPGIGRGLVARPFALAEGREGDLQDHNSAPLPPSPFIRPLGSNLGEKEEEAEEEEDLRRKLVAASSRGILSLSLSFPIHSFRRVSHFLESLSPFRYFLFLPSCVVLFFFLARENGRENAALLLLQTAAAHPYRVWRRPPQPSPVAHWRASFSFLFLLHLQPTVLFPRKENRTEWDFFLVEKKPLLLFF